MTHPTPHGQVPEALRLAAEVLDWMPTSDTQRALWDRHQKALVVVKAALVEAQQPAPSAAAGARFDGLGFRDLVLGNMPDDTIIGSSAWRAKRFVNAAPQPSPTPQADSQPAPIDMVLHCPKCGLQHIDAPEKNDRRLAAIDPPAAWAMDPWTNEPHRSHLCHGCGHIWRPADVPTNGVAAVKTTGKADSPIAARAPADSVLEDAAFEAVRKKLCALPRYSFVLDDDGLVRRVEDRTGNWIEFEDAHELFDPVAVDAARKQGGAT